MSIANVTIQVAGKTRTVAEYTRGQAVKQFCRDCMCGVTAEVRNCSAPGCPLFVFRPYQTPTDDPQN
jgi:hypothetical protein